MSDFNHVTLKKTVPNVQQYVTCPTRKDKILDLCYGSLEEAYKSSPLPPLGHRYVPISPAHIQNSSQEGKKGPKYYINLIFLSEGSICSEATLRPR